MKYRYQNAVIYFKLPQVDIFINLFNSKALQNLPKLGFLV
jgi:hypothetical protein